MVYACEMAKDEKVWEAALSAARSELESVRETYVALTDRMDKLNRTVRSIEALLGRESEPEPVANRAIPTTIHVNPGYMRVDGSSGRISSAPRSRPLLGGSQPVRDTDEAGSETDEVRLRRISPTSSTARVAEIVERAGLPLTVHEIYEAFRARDWLEEDWDSPEAAVTAAARRAHQRNLVVRLPGRRYAPLYFPTDPTNTDAPTDKLGAMHGE